MTIFWVNNYSEIGLKYNSRLEINNRSIIPLDQIADIIDNHSHIKQQCKIWNNWHRFVIKRVKFALTNLNKNNKPYFIALFYKYISNNPFKIMSFVVEGKSYNSANPVSNTKIESWKENPQIT